MNQSTANTSEAATPVESFRAERQATATSVVGISPVDGNVATVFARIAWESVVPTPLLDAAVAVLSGAPAWTNLASLWWAESAQGKPKRDAIARQLRWAALAMIPAAFVPYTGWGLLLFVLGCAGARLCWGGMITIRSTLWRCMYPAKERGRYAGWMSIITALTLAMAGATSGMLLERDHQTFRIILLVGAIALWLGSILYRRIPAPAEPKLIEQERAEHRPKPRPWRDAIAILQKDRGFSRYMAAMFVFGSGNLMAMPIIIQVIRERFEQGYFGGILLGSTLPMLVLPFAVPRWAKFFDRVHILRYRLVHGWFFVSANVFLLTASLTGTLWLLFLAISIRALAMAGGSIGWTLGHLDYAPPGQAGRYMGVHVTLTGLRGVVAPGIGALAYRTVEVAQPGQGGMAFILCVVLSFAGMLMFRRSVQLDAGAATGRRSEGES